MHTLSKGPVEYENWLQMGHYSFSFMTPRWIDSRMQTNMERTFCLDMAPSEKWKRWNRMQATTWDIFPKFYLARKGQHPKSACPFQGPSRVWELAANGTLFLLFHGSRRIDSRMQTSTDISNEYHWEGISTRVSREMEREGAEFYGIKERLEGQWIGD